MAEQGAVILYGDGQEEYYSHPYVHTPHVASALVDDGLYDNEVLEEAMKRAIQVCLYMNVPVQHHFRHLYVQSDTGSTQEDWALSDFAFYLLLMNGRSLTEDVAYAQAYALHHAFCR
jgi:hypothetical protein